jgi:hypothetical protein
MKMNTSSPSEDLQTIRDIMERSSKFLSLSGLSGIFAGICALVGAVVAWFLLQDSGQLQYDEFFHGLGLDFSPAIRTYLAIDAVLVLVCALVGAAYFSYRKARKAGQPAWTPSTRRMVLHLIIPLVTGGLFVLILMFHGHMELIIPAMLIFYGLSLVNAGKFTFGEIHYLGLIEIALGVVAGIFVNYGLLLWAVGFGLMHIVYGWVMYYRYEGIGRRA